MNQEKTGIFINGFNTQPRGGGCIRLCLYAFKTLVSTHSRAEAAALLINYTGL